MRKQLPLILVLAVVVVGLIRIIQYYWREGAVLLGVALLLAALLRALLPTERAGLVAIRGRGIDVLLYSGLGFAVMVFRLYSPEAQKSSLFHLPKRAQIW